MQRFAQVVANVKLLYSVKGDDISVGGLLIITFPSQWMARIQAPVF